MCKYNGAISLFMVIIIMTSFIFGGVFIDASRIIVAKSKVKNAMNSALRSSVSYYDKALVGDYGLYGESADEADKQFKKYFEINMKIKDENLNMFDYSIVNSGVEASIPISDSDEFKRQVVEYSKYRAPVTTTMMLIEKVTDAFKMFKSGSDKAKKSTDALDDFKKQFKADGNQISEGIKSAKSNLAKQVKERINSNAESLKSSTGSVGELRSSIDNLFGEMEKEFADSNTTLDKMVDDTQKYRQSAADDIASINGEAVKTTEEIEQNDGVDSYPKADSDEDDISVQADKQAADSGTFRKAVDNLHDNILAKKQNVDNLLGELERISGQCVSAKNQLSGLKSELSAAEKEYSEKSKILSSTLSNYQKAQSAKDNFDKAKKALQDCEKKLNDAKTKLIKSSGDNEAVSEYSGTYSNTSLTENEASEKRRNIRAGNSHLAEIFNCIDSYNSAKKTYDSAAQANSENPAGLKQAYDSAAASEAAAKSKRDSCQNQVNAKESEIAGYEAEIDDITNRINAIMNEISGASTPEVDELKLEDIAKNKIKNELNKVDIVKEIGSMLEKLGREMSVYNASAQEGDNVDSVLDDGIISKLKSITDYASDFFGTFTNPAALRDNAYMVDYIMDRCTYLTSQTSRNHYFEKGEVEYIIFGKKSQVGNITACIATITMMRFVINFIDYFITGPGDLIGKAIYALGRGAAKTYLDMRTMFISDAANGVGLCPSFDTIKLTYSDHLRLMLFFKFSQQQEKLKDTIYTNMRETLHGGDINSLYTKMKANVEVEVNLIILPIFFGSFTGANFRNGNFVIKDSAVIHY